MKAYLEAVKDVLNDWKKASLVIILTVARVIYGLAWLKAGIGKIGWLNDGKINSLGIVEKAITNLAGPEVTSFDPLLINKLYGWVASNVFVALPAVTDILVVVFEISVGLFLIIGFKVFLSALLATFMNLQFMAAGIVNSFGYVWANLIFMKFAKYTEVLGLDGFLRVRKGKDLI